MVQIAFLAAAALMTAAWLYALTKAMIVLGGWLLS